MNLNQKSSTRRMSVFLVYSLTELYQVINFKIIVIVVVDS